MTLDEYRQLFDGMPAGLTEVNVVGGGEPLVHPQCVDIMREIKRHKWRGYLMTNGSLLREGAAAAMVEMGWDLTRFSVHAGDAATYRAIHGVDHFERLRENMQTLDRLRRAAGRQQQVAMHVHNVIQRENLDAIPYMFELAAAVGADQIVFEIVFALSPHVRLTKDELGRAADALAAAAATARTPSNAEHITAELRREQGDAPSRPLPKPAPPPPGPQPDRPRLAEQTAGMPTPPAAPAAPPPVHQEPVYRPANRCSVGFDSSMVTAQGQVVPCCFSTEVLGNVREQSFKDIWYGKAYTDFRHRLITGQFPEYCSRMRCKLKSFLHD
jgi:radical SAM protein with 4Fe4S-binding SPASM domain